MLVEIEGRINVDGQWWDIKTSHTIQNSLPTDQKIGKIKGIIKGLASTKQVISRVGVAPPFVEIATEPTPGAGEATPQVPMFTWPSPSCGEHKETMKESTVQKEPGFTHFFCAQRMGQGYCNQRAKVEHKTTKPTFWQVK